MEEEKKEEKKVHFKPVPAPFTLTSHVPAPSEGFYDENDSDE